MAYFTLLLLATCFGSIYSSQLQAEVEPKHIARNNNVKYSINPNNNYKFSCVRLYILQFIC